MDLDEGLDPEGPSDEDLERFGDEFVTCPHCGSLVYDQAELCQACGMAVSDAPKRTPAWIIVAAALALVAFVLWFVL